MMLKKNIKNITYFDIYNSSLPLLTNESEIIATSFNKDNYYYGCSFFRTQIDTIPNKTTESQFKLAENDFIILNYSIYYGCVFETEIENLNYDKFDDYR